MVDDLIILPEAELDIIEAYEWYEEQQPGLGDEFLQCVDACFKSIQRHPRAYQIVYKDYRRALVRRFPYAAFYEYVDGIVTVYSVFHSSQNPKKWRKRLL